MLTRREFFETSASAAAVAAIGIPVAAFGAVSDDDNALLQRIIDMQASSETIEIPPGTYRLRGDGVTIPPDKRVIYGGAIAIFTAGDDIPRIGTKYRFDGSVVIMARA